MNEQFTNQLFVYKRTPSNSGIDNFEHVKRVVIKDIDIFRQVCMKYHFKDIPGSNEKDTIIFAKIDCIFELNFVTETVKVVHKFRTQLNRQPLFFEPNKDQSIFVIASPEDCIHLNMKTGNDLDIDMEYDISTTKSVIFDQEEDEDEGIFYILSNKYEEKLGFFILKLDNTNPRKANNDNKFLIKWKNKLDIGDPNLQVLRNFSKEGEPMKELIISYKTIFINTYNVVCMDISIEDT